MRGRSRWGTRDVEVVNRDFSPHRLSPRGKQPEKGIPEGARSFCVRCRGGLGIAPASSTSGAVAKRKVVCGSRDRGITVKQAKTRLLFISVVPTAQHFLPPDPIDFDRVIGDDRCLGVSAFLQPDRR